MSAGMQVLTGTAAACAVQSGGLWLILRIGGVL
jgi:hypothetical protein